MKKSIVFFTLLITLFCLNAPAQESVTDIEGNVYKTVKIGDQVWMAENLKTTHYADGKGIPFVNDSKSWAGLYYNARAYCWYHHHLSSDPGIENGKKYGALYTWSAAMNGAGSDTSSHGTVQGICPEGWHIPTDMEWMKLANFISEEKGYDTVLFDLEWLNVGKHIKASGEWGYKRDNNDPDDYGFSALPGSYRNEKGGCYDLLQEGYWWSSTEAGSTSAVFWYLKYIRPHLYRSYNSDCKKRGLAVRCIKD